MRFGDRALIALVSGHRDGQLVSKCAWHYSIGTVMGSTGRGGLVAVRQLIRWARRGHSLVITPDVELHVRRPLDRQTNRRVDQLPCEIVDAAAR